jgi:hypothetical protein
MNAIGQRCSRLITYFHLPVPIRRDDEGYFAPLKNLRTDPRTTLSLGLIHREDGVAGARRRISAARQFVQKFDIATECGMGRERVTDIPGLLTLHRDVLTDLNAKDGTD